ncbi:MAG TPA: hypothetical protein VF403_05560, partial [Kofleriaceae bacterium]
LRVTCLISIVIAGCGGGACLIPGDDGSCGAGGGGGGGGGPSFHSYGDPQLLKLAGSLALVVSSADDSDQYFGYAGDYREELALPPPADGTAPMLLPTAIPDGYSPSVACSDVCIAAWHTEQDATVRATIRDAGGWSPQIAFDKAIQSPAVAAFGDVLLVAWGAWEDDVGARVELRRLDRSGTVTGSWTLATGTTQGHLSVTASAIGGLVTWQRVDATSEHYAAWIDAQLLDANGAPDGAPLEQPITSGDTDYYRGAPAVYASGVYRVTHAGLGDGGPWFAVDPVARTITLDPLAGLTGPIDQIVPLADGFALVVGGLAIVHVVGDQLVQSVAITGPATIASVAGGGLTAAYAKDGSVYVASIPPTLDSVDDEQPVAIRYQVDGGGCSSTRGDASFVLVIAACALIRRRHCTG